MWSRLLPVLAAGALGTAAIVLLTMPGRSTSPAAPLLTEIERIAEAAGFGLDQVTLTGHRFTVDSDVFDAIGLDHARTMLTFDSRAAKERIERLPWVERASLTRIVPDRVDVHITERIPFAVWRKGARYVLIDKTGRELALVPPDAMPALPRLAGVGAAGAAGELFRELAAHPALLRQVTLAERVGDRRWTLRLANGVSVHLPEGRESAALTRAAALLGSGTIRASEVDLRVLTRVLVRPKARAAAWSRPSAAGAADDRS